MSAATQPAEPARPVWRLPPAQPSSSPDGLVILIPVGAGQHCEARAVREGSGPTVVKYLRVRQTEPAWESALPVRIVQLCATQRVVAAVSEASAVYLFDAANGRLLAPPLVLPAQIHRAVAAADGLLFVVTVDGTALLWYGNATTLSLWEIVVCLSLSLSVFQLEDGNSCYISVLLTCSCLQGCVGAKAPCGDIRCRTDSDRIASNSHDWYVDRNQLEFVLSRFLCAHSFLRLHFLIFCRGYPTLTQRCSCRVAFRRLRVWLPRCVRHLGRVL